MPTGRIRRTATPAALLLRSGAVAALSRARSIASRQDAVSRQAAEEERLARAATHAAEVMGGMKGAVMKIGQLLSFVDTNLVPEAYRGALTALQADAPPMPPELVDDVVRTELGANPRDIFDWFSPEPMAAASIGQVHMARIEIDGVERELVVKVQYPGIADAIAADLSNGALLASLGTLVQTILRDLIPPVDMKAVIAEIADRVGEELDYRIEAENQQRFAALWRDEPTIHVPDVIPELSTRRVLTMTYDDGMRFAAAQQESPELRDQWGLAISRFVFGSLYIHRLFNADPHPGNYLFHDDGTVTFIDFGCVKELTEASVDTIRGYRHAVMSGDEDAIIDSLLAMGTLRKRPDATATAQIIEFVRRDWAPLTADQPFHYSKAWAAGALDSMLDAGIGGNAQRHFDLPEDLVFLLRITAGLSSVLAGLECTINWDELGPEVWGPKG